MSDGPLRDVSRPNFDALTPTQRTVLTMALKDQAWLADREGWLLYAECHGHVADIGRVDEAMGFADAHRELLDGLA